jgi:hypothetical protein
MVWTASKDFWQLQEEEKWDVRSRYLDRMAEKEQEAAEKMAATVAFWREPEAATLDSLNQATKDLGFTFSSAFEDAIISGNSLRDVMQGLLEDITRIVLRQTVTGPLAGAISTGIGGLFGQTPLSDAAGYSGMAATRLNFLEGQMFHDGGKVVPRFHFGGRTDEIPAILQTGETVLDREHTRNFDKLFATLNGGGGLGGGTTVQQTIQVDARGSSVSAADLEAAVERGARQGYQAVYDDFDGRGPISRRIG